MKEYGSLSEFYIIHQWNFALEVVSHASRRMGLGEMDPLPNML